MTGFLWALLMPPLSVFGWMMICRAAGWPAVFRAWPLRRLVAEAVPPCWFASSLVIAVTYGIASLWPEMGGSLASAAIAACIWFWRKRRDRVRAWLGAKSRALRDRLTQRMPRPVALRPTALCTSSPSTATSEG